jgi:hypothetical protein
MAEAHTAITFLSGGAGGQGREGPPGPPRDPAVGPAASHSPATRRSPGRVVILKLHTQWIHGRVVPRWADDPAAEPGGGKPWRWLGATCLVLFPLLFIVFGGTGIHPGPSGTTQDQIRLVAAVEARWRLVHLILAAASLVGIGAVVTPWMMAVRGRSGILTWVGDLGLVFGVAGAALLSGVVLMEAGLVAPLATACAQSPACLSPGGTDVAEAIAGLGWRNVDPLTWAGGRWRRGCCCSAWSVACFTPCGYGRRRCWCWPRLGAVHPSRAACSRPLSTALRAGGVL